MGEHRHSHRRLDYTPSAVANYCGASQSHTHTQTGEGEGDWVLGGAVLSRCRNVYLDLSDISEGGQRVIRPASPTLTPSLRGGVSTFSENQQGPKCDGGGSSNKNI